MRLFYLRVNYLLFDLSCHRFLWQVFCNIFLVLGAQYFLKVQLFDDWRLQIINLLFCLSFLPYYSSSRFLLRLTLIGNITVVPLRLAYYKVINLWLTCVEVQFVSFYQMVFNWVVFYLLDI